VRSLLAWEEPERARGSGDEQIILLSELPESWRGQPIEVHALPTRAGPLSYAVRWHGSRPALLWTAPPGVRICAPGLDAEWWSDDPQGETLLTGAAA
jgi:hypothetical protein